MQDLKTIGKAPKFINDESPTLAAKFESLQPRHREQINYFCSTREQDNLACYERSFLGVKLTYQCLENTLSGTCVKIARDCNSPEKATEEIEKCWQEKSPA